MGHFMVLFAFSIYGSTTFCAIISTKPPGEILLTKPSPEASVEFITQEPKVTEKASNHNGQSSYAYQPSPLFTPHIKNFTKTYACLGRHCQKIYEIRLNNTFDFNCKAKHLHVNFELEDQITNKLSVNDGYLDQDGDIVPLQEYEDCFALRQYFINKEQSIVVFNNKLAKVENKRLNAYIRDQLFNSSHYAIYALYVTGMFDVKKDDVSFSTFIFSLILLSILIICMIIIKNKAAVNYRLLSQYVIHAFRILTTEVDKTQKLEQEKIEHQRLEKERLDLLIMERKRFEQERIDELIRMEQNRFGKLKERTLELRDCEILEDGTCVPINDKSLILRKKK